jgi:hypothetical protein
MYISDENAIKKMNRLKNWVGNLVGPKSGP